ncbi:MAG: glycerol-3-phosphate 1-O-acyltransferase PlsY [Acidobacteria bacterium]|nr:glycerol-3-phosphate 1-O-acyltransferase PlsY [Acidobacteriota bacterium]
MTPIALAVLAGYALGAVPFAFLVARASGGVDLRRVGSGNVGATNVLRTTRRSAAVAALALDTLKGTAAVWAGGSLGGETGAVWAGGAAVVGHVYPAWLRFQGGKGVATAAGAFAVLAPIATLAALVVFAIAVAITQRVSVGSLCATIALPAVAWVLVSPRAVVVGAALVAGLIGLRHRENVRRLAGGTEPRLGDRVRSRLS